MPTLKLHYEGWVSLPAVLRQQLGLNSGDRLDVDLVDGTIVLRPAATTKRPAPREDQAAVIDSPAPDAPETLTLTDAMPARRKPGRPRKHDAAAEVVAPTPKRPRGRPRAVRAPEPEPAPCVRSTTRPGSCGARRTCSRRGRACSMPRCRVPAFLGPEARRARRRKSAVRFAMSRYASLGRAASTTDLRYPPEPSAPPLERQSRPSAYGRSSCRRGVSIIRQLANASARPVHRVVPVPFGNPAPPTPARASRHSRAAVHGRCV